MLIAYGYQNDLKTLHNSSSGGAFSAIVDAFVQNNTLGGVLRFMEHLLTRN